MLKVEVGNDCGIELLATGNVVELATDVCVTIKGIYEHLKVEQVKEFFIEKLQAFLDEGLYKMSSEEIEELNRKKIEQVEAKIKEEAEKKVKEKEDFKNDIKTMIDLMKKVLEEK